jgi:hypothetical protein
MKTYETLSEAMQALEARGYIADFNIHPEWIESPTLGIKLSPDEFHVDEVHRFEGMTDPDDSAVLYAVSSTAGMKGLLVDAYGAYSSYLSSSMVQKLNIDSKTKH